METMRLAGKMMGLGASSELASAVSSLFVSDQELITGQGQRVVGTRPSTYGVSPSYASLTCGTSRTRHSVKRACTNIVLVYSGIKTLASFATPSELGIGNDWEIKASIHLISSGITEEAVLPVRFRGRRLALVPNATFLFSDPIPVYLPAGKEFFVYTFANRLASASYSETGGEVGLLAADKSYYPREYGNRVDAAGTGFDLGVGTQYSTSTGIDPFTLDKVDGTYAGLTLQNITVVAPCAILGDELSTSQQPSVALIGDSILAGSADYSGSRFPWSGLGYFHYYLSGQCPLVQCSLGGDGAQYKVNAYAYNFANRAGIASRASIAYLALGTNDIVATRTVAQVKADLVEFATQLKARGVSKIVGATILPRTTSTDGWQTLVNQTVTTTNNFNTKRDELNAWLRTTPAPYDGVIDLCPAVEDLATGKWKAPDSAPTTAVTTTGSTTTVVQLASPTLVANAEIGKYCFIGSDMRVITTNTASAITVSPALSGTPSSDVTFQIYDPYVVDGTHPSQWGHYKLGQTVASSTLFASA